MLHKVPARRSLLGRLLALGLGGDRNSLRRHRRGCGSEISAVGRMTSRGKRTELGSQRGGNGVSWRLRRWR
jgi:hypothetical protein